MRITLAQINPIVGDLEYNAQKIFKFASQAHAKKADLIIYPELALTGYPPKDLLLRPDFLNYINLYLEKLTQIIPVPIILGAPMQEQKKLFNSAVFLSNKKFTIIGKKILLPNYNVFDEKRYFSAPDNLACPVFEFKNKKFLITICEDAWSSENNYDFDPINNSLKKHKNIDLIINLSASPFSQTKPKRRENIFCNIAKTYNTPVCVCGQVGANDQLLFDGHSLVINSQGDIINQAPLCKESLTSFSLPMGAKVLAQNNLENNNILVKNLIMGIQDYVKKTQHSGVVIGISGGIDSAICCALACRALGPKNVRAFYLPSKFSSTESHQDAQLLCDKLGVKLDIINIENHVNNLRSELKNYINNYPVQNQQLFDQNIQARIRGLILMGLSNLSGYLMIAPSNKSELAVGYTTIYGDMCGAFSPIGDIYKTQLKKLAQLLEIPHNIIIKEPSAELIYNQKDSDTLPDYQVLDLILYYYLELNKNIKFIQNKTNLDINIISQVVNLTNKSEYKRRQAPLSFMVTDRVFGDARRLPLAQNFTPPIQE